MNPIYQKVLDIKDELINNFKVDVEVSQITTEEWEKWNTSEDSFKDSNQIIETPNLTIHTDKKDHSIDSKSPEISNSDEDNFRIKIHQRVQQKNKSLLEEMLNNEFSEELKDKQDDKFDFFDFEDDTEDEDELDIIEDSDLENNDDPVIKAAGSILSTCSR